VTVRSAILLAVVAVLLAYLATGIAQVERDERAVVRRFGRVVARPGPGLWVGWPWGIDRVDKVKVDTVRQLEVGYVTEATEDSGSLPPGQYLTGDQNLVNAKLVLEYAIDDRDGELESYVIQQDRVEAVLGRELDALAAEWIGGRPVDEVLLTGRAALPQYAMKRLAARLKHLKLGVVVQRVSIQSLAAPQEVREAFEAVNQAQTGIRTRENQAQQEASQRLREAESVKYRSEQQAIAYRTEQKSAAEAERDTFAKRLEQYRKLKATNPDLLTAIWWDEMGRTLVGLKSRGRIELLDQHLGADGLDITWFLPPKRK